MRSRFVYALPSVLLALAAVGIGIYGLLLKPQPPAESVEAVHVSGASAQDQTPTYTYSIVTGKVPAGEVVDPRQLLPVDVTTEIPGAIPAEAVPLDEPVKREVRTGELLMGSAYDSETRIPTLLEDGARAMAVELTPLNSVGGLVRPGDYVDIFGSFRGEGDKEPLTVELLRRVKVLAVQGETSVSSDQDNDNQRRNQTMVLSVAREQVPRLVLASLEARLSFVGSVAGEVETDEVEADEVEADEPLAVVLSEIRPEPPEPEAESPAHAPRERGAEQEPGGTQGSGF